MNYSFSLFLICLPFTAAAQTQATPAQLLGRWEVIRYSEQGVQVDKKQAALPQAQAVYAHVGSQRAAIWYGYDETTGERPPRRFERWEERDSIAEVKRVTKAIAMPYFAVFFADSTLALYNKEDFTHAIYFPESRRYVFSPSTMSIDILQPGGYGKIEAQVLLLTDRRLLLFLPEEAEIVELVKTEFVLP